MVSKKASKGRAKKASSKVSVKKKAAAKKAAAKKETAVAPATATALTGLRSDIDDLFDRYVPHFPRRLMDWDPFKALEIPSFAMPKWGAAPSVDLSETDKGYKISADVPGLDEKDIEVSVTDTMLTIKGEKQEEREEEKKDYHMRERRYGSFQRSFRIPDDVDASKVSAKFSKGLLEISLPKTAKSKSAKRQLKVEAG